MADTSSTSQDLVRILIEIHKKHRSGVLRFERETVKKQLVVRLGFLALAESTEPDEHLARVLVNLRLLSRTALPGISSLIRAGKTTEQAIMRAAKLDISALEKGACEQAVAIVASLLGWEGYEMRFYAGEGLVRRELDLNLPLPQVLVLAARRAVSERLVPRLPRTLQGRVHPTRSSQDDLPILPLDGAEAYTFSLIKGPTPVEDILPLLPSGLKSPEHLILRLVVLGMLRLDTPVAREPSAAKGRAVEGIEKEVEELLHRFEVANLYEILSVPTDAGEDRIKRAYHELARRFHPDRFPSKDYEPAFRNKVQRLFTYVTGAHTTLSNKASRAAYDETRLKKESEVEAALQARAATDLEQEKMAKALYRVGRAALAKGDYGKAEVQLRECVWLRPGVAKYQHSLGVAQTEIPSLRKQAEQHLLKALEIDHTTVDTRLALARLYLKVNLPKRAEAQLQEVLEWDPSNPEAHRLLEEMSGKDPHGGGLASRIKRPLSR